jgi:hypothetical protein
MIVWLIERGWGRLVLVALLGAMLLAAMTYDPPRPSEPPCVIPRPGRGLGRATMPPSPGPPGR